MKRLVLHLLSQVRERVSVRERNDNRIPPVRLLLALRLGTVLVLHPDLC